MGNQRSSSVTLVTASEKHLANEYKLLFSKIKIQPLVRLIQDYAKDDAKIDLSRSDVTVEVFKQWLNNIIIDPRDGSIWFRFIGQRAVIKMHCHFIVNNWEANHEIEIRFGRGCKKIMDFMTFFYEVLFAKLDFYSNFYVGHEHDSCQYLIHKWKSRAGWIMDPPRFSDEQVRHFKMVPISTNKGKFFNDNGLICAFNLKFNNLDYQNHPVMMTQQWRHCESRWQKSVLGVRVRVAAAVPLVLIRKKKKKQRQKNRLRIVCMCYRLMGTLCYH
jgi:hypothetical protein